MNISLVGGALRETRPEKEIHFLDTQNFLLRVAFLFYGASQRFRGLRKKRSGNRLAPAPCFMSWCKDDLRMNEPRRVSRTLTQVETRLNVFERGIKKWNEEGARSQNR